MPTTYQYNNTHCTSMAILGFYTAVVVVPLEAMCWNGDLLTVAASPPS
jgi:hypothetical protein